MRESLKTILQKHIVFWKDTSVRYRVLLSVGLLFISLVLTYFSKIYTKIYAVGTPIPDVLLDHIPVINVAPIFFQGAFFFLIVLVGILLYEPKYVPFTVESTALFFFIRSVFAAMTHLASPGTATYQYINYEHHVREVLFTLSSGNDLFFSGHAGFPFLLALIFWKNIGPRYFFLACSVIGSLAVIFGHLHYSIDVFSAFFISFGIVEIAKKIFKKEYALLGIL